MPASYRTALGKCARVQVACVCLRGSWPALNLIRARIAIHTLLYMEPIRWILAPERAEQMAVLMEEELPSSPISKLDELGSEAKHALENEWGEFLISWMEYRERKAYGARAL